MVVRQVSVRYSSMHWNSKVWTGLENRADLKTCFFCIFLFKRKVISSWCEAVPEM